MRLEQLQYLLSLQQTGSITQTAEQFFISHQAVSKSIKALEKELSVVLFERSSKGVLLTAAGERVCQFAQEVLQKQSLLQEDLAPYRVAKQKIPQGALTIYAIPRYITPPFLKFIRKFQTAYPQIDIRLHNETAEKIIHQIPFDSATVGLFTTCYEISDQLLGILDKRQLYYQVLDSQVLYACVHNKSPLAMKKLLSETETRQYPFVSFTYTSYQSVADEMPPPQFVVDSFEQQKALLKQGNCFGRCTAKEYELFFAKDFTLIPLEDRTIMRFVAIYLQEHEPLIDFFLAHYCKENGLSPQGKKTV